MLRRRFGPQAEAVRAQVTEAFMKEFNIVADQIRLSKAAGVSDAELKNALEGTRPKQPTPTPQAVLKLQRELT